jgi:hypothetical protein
VRIGQHRQQVILAGLGVLRPMGGTQGVGQIGQAVQMQGAGAADPGRQGQQRAEPGIDLAAKPGRGRHKTAQQRAHQGKPDHAAGQFLGPEVRQNRGVGRRVRNWMARISPRMDSG